MLPFFIIIKFNLYFIKILIIFLVPFYHFFCSPNNNDDVNKGDNEGENDNLTKKATLKKHLIIHLKTVILKVLITK